MSEAEARHHTHQLLDAAKSGVAPVITAVPCRHAVNHAGTLL